MHKKFITSCMISLLVISTSSTAKAPPIQLATNFREDITIQDYYVSEKLDGLRAYWDGKQLISKQGNLFTAPSWFIASFPTVPLDGELWIARQQFEKVSGIVRTQDSDNAQWKQVKFMVFDLPQNPLSFGLRVDEIAQIISQANSPYLQQVKQEKLPSIAALFSLLDEVVAAKGEGLMLHHQDALYETKRNNDLMKLKKFEDAEATVISHFLGKGKYQGYLGSLLVENNEGVRFKIGSGFSDEERQNPPPIGSTITYRFTGKTINNVPRFASFIRVRVIY
jgi:DNA ligase 1